MNRLLAIALVVSLAGACGPKSMFRLTSDDNDRAAISTALAKRKLPEQATPINAARAPRMFVVQNGAPKTIVAYDLNAASVMWKMDADVQSRVWVGGDFILTLEGKQLVARDQKSGSPRWKVGIQGEFVGAAADRDRAYVTWREGTNAKPTWIIAGFDASSGKEAWRAPSEGELGAPSVHAGVVLSPFLRQWLYLVDGATGQQLARLRGIDEQISVVRVTSRASYFGSKQGVFALDARAASGKKTEATYGQVKIPPQLDRTSYGVDLYDNVQTGYTAADRARVLWASEPTESGPMKFTGDTYAVHYFRYVFGFDLAGELAWAYSNPRVELVASEHTGGAIVVISTQGDIVALDPKTGAVRQKKNLGLGAQVLGATIDADGWVPPGDGEKVETVAALVSIARDRDARFDRVKELAVSSLAKLPGGQVTKELLAVLSDKRAPQKLKDTVVEMLTKRKDPASLPVLATQLQVRADFIAKTEPESVGPVAKAIASLSGTKLDPKDVTLALAALQGHLDDPATQTPELVMVIRAMAAIGAGAERTVLGSHLLLYHADDDLGADNAWQTAIVTALDVHGGPGEKELLRQVAADPRTKPGLATTIKDALVND
ncbi:MAG TPA: PQQ-binding-like beta-propeller repeat protein [Kofleriaceae bacterium]